ncbi:hypothetical protein PoB_005722800 [Plakobranchus ocellatus]|uniref:Uncharacterized protein n=1 Tax=Plakobranchus ocellatus TaxID=259542 RepID=A0AAV4CGP5_9GAST|nr:hypothetical protein PoB_005722800 [Plakobranchus ocellatus]
MTLYDKLNGEDDEDNDDDDDDDDDDDTVLINCCTGRKGLRYNPTPTRGKPWRRAASRAGGQLFRSPTYSLQCGSRDLKVDRSLSAGLGQLQSQLGTTSDKS